jgi:hypothetical protein
METTMSIDRELTESELDMVAGGNNGPMSQQVWLSDFNWAAQYASHMTQRQTSSDQSIIGNIRP